MSSRERKDALRFAFSEPAGSGGLERAYGMPDPRGEAAALTWALVRDDRRAADGGERGGVMTFGGICATMCRAPRSTVIGLTRPARFLIVPRGARAV